MGSDWAGTSWQAGEGLRLASVPRCPSAGGRGGTLVLVYWSPALPHLVTVSDSNLYKLSPAVLLVSGKYPTPRSLQPPQVRRPCTLLVWVSPSITACGWGHPSTCSRTQPLGTSPHASCNITPSTPQVVSENCRDELDLHKTLAVFMVHVALICAKLAEFS